MASFVAAPAEPRIVIVGGKRLVGTIPVSGSKNASLAILAGAILAAEGETVLHGLPRIGDIETMALVLQQLGVRTAFENQGRTLRINASSLTNCEAPPDLVARMRASFWVLGPVLARLGEAKVTQPGGCNIGARPIDLHLKGLAALGADLDVSFGSVTAVAGQGLRGAKIYLDFPSVGATMNLMMAASLAEGVTVIENAAQEPDVEDLGNFLIALGARVQGHGTGMLTVQGVRRLRGAEYTVSADRMEAGTFGVMAGITGGNVLLEPVDPIHMRPITLKMIEAGMRIEEGPNFVRCIGPDRPRFTNLTAMPHPGFPTDMQQAFTAMLTVADGTSVITDNVYENRFRFLTEMARMGARSQVNGRTAVISGVARLTGADVEASDLRAGAALVTAGLAAHGQTRVFKTEHLHRGYERFVEKLTAVGAEIWREDEFGRPLGSERSGEGDRETAENRTERGTQCSPA
ncbi:MAG: UDP-N-acetylglucosamine 1-carboxyvinyltransferase [Capsulimonadales bacterium]|nr:UDP-N-acetylglucosamine 1-carboxyvinyltransferase [Capsulimonadales bacterium]